MVFSGQYLTYSEYKSLGGTLDIAPFNLLEFEARKQIDRKTQNRLLNVSEIPDEVKLCTFHLIERMYDYTNASQSSSNNNVVNESIDGYSITYISPTQIAEVISSKNYEINNIINNDLFGVIVNNEHILYLGVK